MTELDLYGFMTGIYCIESSLFSRISKNCMEQNKLLLSGSNPSLYASSFLDH